MRIAQASTAVVRLHDLILELRIRFARYRMVRAKGAAETRRHASRMTELIKMRSDDQIYRMERARGLL